MPNTVDLSRIVSSVQIDGVRLREASCRSLLDRSGVSEELVATASHEASVTKEPRDDATFVISVSFSLEIRDAVGANDLHAEVSAVFDLAYSLPGAVTFPAEELEGFAHLNSVFNAWPYWREIVQTSLSRMAMPVLTVPLYRLPRRDSAKDED